MGSFNQMTQKSVVKKEVSNDDFKTGEHSDYESLPGSSSESCESTDSSKRFLDCEQDLQSTDSSGSPLPPRKRAKTQEEKEQRRIERIMRNRQAAHASREKKRKHLEALEARCSELESENSRLKSSLSNYDQMCARLQQLEASIRNARSSGDISSLDSITPMAPAAPAPEALPIDGTVNGMVVGAAAKPNMSLGFYNEASLATSGSPAPSLEEDCASPEALLKIKTEEEIFHPFSPENVSASDLTNEDPFGIMNFSFDTDPSTSDAPVLTDSSSKSRHPAALTPPLFEILSPTY